MNTPLEEYQSATQAAACFDLCGRTQLELTGGDRAKFLHNFCTNDINRLQPGTGCEAFVTNIKGRVLAHVFVFAGADTLWLDSVAGAEETLTAHLDRYLIADDVTIRSRTGEYGELFVSGPRTVDALTRAGIDVGGLDLNGHAPLDGEEPFTAVRRVDWLRVPGILLPVERDKLAEAAAALAAAGIPAAGPETFEAVRIEAGFPLYGRDISEQNIAQEVGRTPQAISFTKGCYLGQEPIARLDALGHVNRQLARLKLSAGPLPAADAPILAAEGDTEIGRITSAAVSPADNLPAALGYLRTQYLAAGTQVAVRVGDVSVPASVGIAEG